ncbi:MAG TPA: hypothetical protein VG324_13360 [Blastocatellia bacterium]|nr:hypothetical protein [Blastocatellia bacterium]
MASTVFLVAVAVGAGLLYLYGVLGAWGHIRYGSILFSLSRYATVGACAFGIYHLARLTAANPPGKSGLWPLWRYLRCVLASGAIGFLIGATLGTHAGDPDPLRGEVVADYVPGDVRGATFALKVFLGALLPGLVGTGVGIREAERESDGRGY